MPEKVRSPTTQCRCVLYLVLQNGFCRHSRNSPQATCQKKSLQHILGWIYRMPLIASLCGACPHCVSGGSWVTARSLPPSCFLLLQLYSILVGPPTGELREELYFSSSQIAFSPFFSLSEANPEPSNSIAQSYS